MIEALNTEAENPVIPAYKNSIDISIINPTAFPLKLDQNHGMTSQKGAMMKPTCSPDTAMMCESPTLAKAVRSSRT